MKVFLSVIAAAIVVALIVMGVVYFEGPETEPEEMAMPQDAVSSSEVSSSGGVTPQDDDAVVAEAVTAGASMAGGPLLTDGEAIYTLYCSACHDPGPRHPGTMMLQQLGQAPDEAALTQHKVLDPDYIRSIVRDGLIEMPPFRPSEISDAQLDALVDYLRQPKSD